MGSGDVLGTSTVPGPPIPKARARTVRGKDGEPHTFTPPRTKAYEELIGWSWTGKRLFAGPVTLRVEVHEGKGHPADLDNFIKSASDALNGIAVVDDKQVTRIEATIERNHPNPSMTVTVLEA